MVFTLKSLSAKRVCSLSTVLLLLLLAGCGPKSAADNQPATDGSTAVAPSETVVADATEPDTNAQPATAQSFATELQASPFANADLGIKESFARALIAYNIGDYDRAFSEATDLKNTAGLTAEQSKAVKQLLARIAKAAPEVAATNALLANVAQPQPEIFPEAAENQPLFSTADPGVRETFDRAQAAFNIGNFTVAAEELKTLVTNAQLNARQRYAAQVLLDKTPQVVPGSK